MNQYYNFTDPAVPGAVVDAIKYNIEMDNITDAFDNFPSPIQFTSGSFNYGVQPAGQPVNTYDIPVTAIPLGTAYKPGNNVAFLAVTANTGPSTLAVSGGVPRALLLGSAGALQADDIRVNTIYTAVWDGAVWRTLEVGARGYTATINYRNQAVQDAADAAGFATTAKNEADAAESSRAATAQSAANALQDSKDATTAKDNTVASQNAARNSQTSAAQSESGAKGSETRSAQMEEEARQLSLQAQQNATDTATIAANAAGLSNQMTTDAGRAATAAQDAQGILTDPNLATRILNVLKSTEYVVGAVELFAVNTDPNTWMSGTTWVRLPPDVTIAMANASGTNIMQTTGSDVHQMTVMEMPQHKHDTPPVKSSDTPLVGTVKDYAFAPMTLQTRSDLSGSLQATTMSLTLGNFTVAPTIKNAGLHAHPFAAQIGTTGYTTSRIRTGVTTSASQNNTQAKAVANHQHTLTAPNHQHVVDLPDHTHYVDGFNPHFHTFTSFMGHSHLVSLPDHGHTGSMTVNNTGSGTQFSVVNSNLKLVAWRRTA